MKFDSDTMYLISTLDMLKHRSTKKFLKYDENHDYTPEDFEENIIYEDDGKNELHPLVTLNKDRELCIFNALPDLMIFALKGLYSTGAVDSLLVLTQDFVIFIYNGSIVSYDNSVNINDFIDFTPSFFKGQDLNGNFVS